MDGHLMALVFVQVVSHAGIRNLRDGVSSPIEETHFSVLRKDQVIGTES